MAQDTKYGRVTLERGSIGEDEPVFVVRAQDALAVSLLREYAELCSNAGSPAQHLTSIDNAIGVFTAWQADNFTQVPQSAPPI